jgi:S1-C subfamily serine protease
VAPFLELAPSHLVKVRAGTRGSGWAIGRQGVLTARHVVLPFLEKKVDQCWAVLDPSPKGPGFSCSIVYEDQQRDLAVLRIADDQAETWRQAIGPGSVVLAKPGTGNVAVDAIGFPDATLSEDGIPDPEPISGELKPAGGAVTGLMPLDVGGTVPAPPCPTATIGCWA